MKIIKKITMQKLILLGLFLSCSKMQNVLAFCEGMGPQPFQLAAYKGHSDILMQVH